MLEQQTHNRLVPIPGGHDKPSGSVLHRPRAEAMNGARDCKTSKAGRGQAREPEQGGAQFKMLGREDYRVCTPTTYYHSKQMHIGHNGTDLPSEVLHGRRG